MIGQRSVNYLPVNVAELEREAELRCASGRAYEEVEDFAKAREVLGVFYAPGDAILQRLPDALRAEVLLRTGSLLRRVADRNRIEADLESAKSYLFEALQIFRRLEVKEKIAETLIAFAAAYWCSDDFARCRHLLNESVFEEVTSPVLRANRLYLLAIVARCERMYEEAVSLYRRALSFCDEIANPALTCKFHGGLASALLFFGEQEGNVACINEALLHYTLSSQQAEESGNVRHAGIVINNLGFILLRHKRYAEARDQLGRARQIFERLQDISCIAQVDETRGQVFNAEGRYKEAIPLLRRSIRTFEIIGEGQHQGEALLTLATSLMKVGQIEDAERAVIQATEIFALNNLTVDEGLALLARAEILATRSRPRFDLLLQTFIRALKLLASSSDVRVAQRLGEVEARLLELSAEPHICQLVDKDAVHNPVMGGGLWDEGLTLDEAKARVEEWYLSRLILEHGTLEAIARQLDLTVEGARLKIARYPHLDLLRKAMRGSNVVPLGASRAVAPLIKLRLANDDDHLRYVGPRGGDLLGADPCDTLAAQELGVIEYKGVKCAGYYDATGKIPTLHSGHPSYPKIDLTEGVVRVVGRVRGYWRKGEEGQGLRPLRKS